MAKEWVVEDFEQEQYEPSEGQKAAIDKELNLIATNPNYLQNWEDVKQRFAIVGVFTNNDFTHTL